ncbi:MAG: UDP-N-acetylmuramoyl-L-alanyl-D-glutamate--2,6-diaminopimelate ligase, partial [Oscillospiraceae bacterium]
MKLSAVMKGIEYEGALIDCEIKDVMTDSRKASDGSAFICIKGRAFDGHSAAREMLDRGAGVVITEHSLGLEKELVVRDTRLAYSKMCQNYFGNPQNELTLIAVTGTNGKTTVTSIIKQALCNLGIKAGLIGTICCEIDDMTIPAKFTTPEAWDVCALFSRMLSAGCTHVVMEASSQALDQGRLLGIEFDCAVFTNLTKDHLDYHGDMESYYRAKKILFSNAKRAVINVDDSYGLRLAKEISIPIDTLSIEKEAADYCAKSITCSIGGVEFDINGKGFLAHVSFPMPGLYSVHNALCAACALFTVGIDKETACRAISGTRGVRGRCEVLYSGEYTVICDFAHTGDALKQLLSSIKPFVKGRMITLFGCAGDRDPLKRPEMAQAAAKYSDFVVVSSDNPRTEDPLKIIDEVRPYLIEGAVDFTAIPDRYFAIKWALAQLKKDDVLVLCGKGHEDYQ